MPKIAAFFFEAEHAEATLANCQSDCVVRGTLRIDPWSGSYYLVTPDGTTILLPSNSFVKISYPSP